MELAVQVARNRHGVAVYPCVETIQDGHICTAVRSPAPIEEKLQKKAQELAIKATEAIDGIGLYAYEFFLTKEGHILLNESAPRPHNSGHYTIEGCITSQFENHVRAVSNLPLGATDLRSPAVVMINLLGTHNRNAVVENAHDVMNAEDGHLHIYGKKSSKEGRKMGHATFLGDDVDELHQKGLRLTDSIRI
mgnify:CR=1 FL=1